MAMSAEFKIHLPAEAREALMKKETRNKLISIGVGLVGTVTGYIVDRKLERGLVDEFVPIVKAATETVTTN